ncbi:MAG: pilus assembly protein PilM, partial [Deltaproteobacteria bacterium]|nr:pilus assembly protein PilM [Deltaproteobacteria bacterium]
PSGLVTSGTVSDEGELADLIRDRLKTLNIDARRVIMGLSSPNSIYRIINLPGDVPSALISDGIKVEAEKAVPVPLSEVYLSHQSLPNGGSDDKRYFLAAYDRKATDSLIHTVSKAGPRPYLLDLAPLCLCRPVKALQAIVASLRGSFFDGVVMADRVPQVIRSLELPVKDELLEGKLSAVAEEIQRVIAFYNSSGPAKPLDSSVPVFISGDLAKSPDIPSILASRLGYSVSVLPSLLDAPDDFPAHNYAINMGLALKESQVDNSQGASLVNFNALPEIYHPKGVSVFSIVAPVALSVSLTASSFMGFAAWNTDKYAKALAAEVTAEKDLIKARQSEVAVIKDGLKRLQDE